MSTMDVIQTIGIKNYLLAEPLDAFSNQFYCLGKTADSLNIWTAALACISSVWRTITLDSSNALQTSSFWNDCEYTKICSVENEIVLFSQI